MITILSANIEHKRLILDLIQKYYAFDHIPFSEDQVATALGVLLSDATLGNAWLIYNGDQVVGYAITTFGFDLEFGGKVVTLTDYYILPPHQACGIGTQALSLIEEHCCAFGACAIELQVEQKNISALSFYKKCGFHPHDRIPHSKRLSNKQEYS